MHKKMRNIVCIVIMIAISQWIGTADVKAAENQTLISSQVGITGFQIRMSNPGDELNVAFRVVCNAPNKGSVITIQDTDYVVKEFGTIYTLDPNTTGDEKNDRLNDSYTLLDSTDYSLLGWEYKYRGLEKYTFGGNYISPTFGYLEEKGVYADWDKSDTENTYYVRTMEMMNDFVPNNIHVRAFVEAEYMEDGETKTAIIYSEKIRSVSVAQIANYFYINGMANSQNAHDYLYNNILHNTALLSKKNPYYLSSAIEYGWNSGVVNP